ncbi:hypothetical protein BDV11DRAFT_117680 [Aspergillus similis]
MSELDLLCILRVRICMNLTILRPADLQRALPDRPERAYWMADELGDLAEFDWGVRSPRQGGRPGVMRCICITLVNPSHCCQSSQPGGCFLLRIVTGCTKSCSFQCLLSHYIAREPLFRNTSNHRQSKILSTSTGVRILSLAPTFPNHIKPHTSSTAASN